MPLMTRPSFVEFVVVVGTRSRRTRSDQSGAAVVPDVAPRNVIRQTPFPVALSVFPNLIAGWNSLGLPAAGRRHSTGRWQSLRSIVQKPACMNDRPPSEAT